MTEADPPYQPEDEYVLLKADPGDVIFSGTPPRSTGPVVPGDVMHAAMEGLGEMTVKVSGGPGRKTPLEGMEPAEPAAG